MARMVHSELMKQLEAAHRQFEEIDIDHSGNSLLLCRSLLAASSPLCLVPNGRDVAS